MSYITSSQNQIQIHTKLCYELTRDHFGGYKPHLIREDCWLIMNRLKENIHAQENLQKLYGYVKEQFFGLEHYYTVINVSTQTTFSSFFDIIILPMIQHYVKEWKERTNSYTIENLIGQSSEVFIQCLCNNDTHNAEDWLINNKFCYRCGKMYHTKCFQAKQSQYYECPVCFLQYCLPDREVKGTLFRGYMPPVEQNSSKMYIIENEWPLENLCNEEISIQLRCVRIGKQYNYQMTWPERCDIYLDDIKSIVYEPLPENSPLKRRHDSSIIIPIRDLACSQKIKICEKFEDISAWHLLAIFIVAGKNTKQIFNTFVNDPYYEINQKQSDQYLQRLFWTTNGVEMEKITISNQCQYYGQKIIYPCRSRHCTSHYQPFDLYNFISSSVQAKSSVKRWKCPICGVRAYDIVRDTKIYKHLRLSQNKKQLEYYCQINQISPSEEQIPVNPIQQRKRSNRK